MKKSSSFFSFALISSMVVGSAVACANEYLTAAVVEPEARSHSRASPSLNLELTYSQRILVPRGSDLAIKIQDAAGRNIFAKAVKTTQDAPPYVVTVPMKSSVAYPLTIDANLASKLGHHFNENVTLAESEAHGIIQIRMKPQ
ncbi:hypothetical protein P0R31_17485 [Bradyrhizobium yuanmingense]|uniref:hypothetical protein n=1 Tax=Bradyrhizobium yuanmingense TaxID=108015 RepID=UPI0023B96044|nr:hypothetical protein [Bradyrhizobium yuanmingense]MDF0519030.1 hypothetical protein [Bradyrhizobium yuanmingense]